MFLGLKKVIVLLLHILSKYNFSKPVFKIITKVKSALGKELQKKTPDTFFTIGFLNGFLPCGLLYMAIFGSFAFESITMSLLYMLVFGLGTIPLMTLVVLAGNTINGAWRQKIQKAIPIFVVLIGMLFILRGLGLGIPYVSPKTIHTTEKVSSQIDCHS